MPSPSSKPLTDSQQLYRRVYADTHLLLLAGLLGVLVVAPGPMPRLLGENRVAHLFGSPDVAHAREESAGASPHGD